MPNRFKRFPVAIRIISFILIMSFLAYDISWACPDALQIELKAAKDDFREAFQGKYLADKAQRIAAFIESRPHDTLQDIVGCKTDIGRNFKGVSFKVASRLGAPTDIRISLFMSGGGTGQEAAVLRYCLKKHRADIAPAGLVPASYCGLDSDPSGKDFRRQLFFTEAFIAKVRSEDTPAPAAKLEAGFRWSRWVSNERRETIGRLIDERSEDFGIAKGDETDIHVSYNGAQDTTLRDLLNTPEGRKRLFTYDDREGLKFIYNAPSPKETRNNKALDMIRGLARMGYTAQARIFRKGWRENKEDRQLIFRRIYAIYHGIMQTREGQRLIKEAGIEKYLLDISFKGRKERKNFVLVFHNDNLIEVEDALGVLKTVFLSDNETTSDDLRRKLEKEVRSIKHAIESETGYADRFTSYLERISEVIRYLKRAEGMLFIDNKDRFVPWLEALSKEFAGAKLKVRQEIKEHIDLAAISIDKEDPRQAIEELSRASALIDDEIGRLHLIIRNKQDEMRRKTSAFAGSHTADMRHLLKSVLGPIGLASLFMMSLPGCSASGAASLAVAGALAGATATFAAYIIHARNHKDIVEVGVKGAKKRARGIAKARDDIAMARRKFLKIAAGAVVLGAAMGSGISLLSGKDGSKPNPASAISCDIEPEAVRSGLLKVLEKAKYFEPEIHGMDIPQGFRISRVDMSKGVARFTEFLKGCRIEVKDGDSLQGAPEALIAVKDDESGKILIIGRSTYQDILAGNDLLLFHEATHMCPPNKAASDERAGMNQEVASISKVFDYNGKKMVALPRKGDKAMDLYRGITRCIWQVEIDVHYIEMAAYAFRARSSKKSLQDYLKDCASRQSWAPVILNTQLSIARLFVSGRILPEFEELVFDMVFSSFANTSVGTMAEILAAQEFGDDFKLNKILDPNNKIDRQRFFYWARQNILCGPVKVSSGISEAPSGLSATLSAASIGAGYGAGSIDGEYEFTDPAYSSMNEWTFSLRATENDRQFVKYLWSRLLTTDRSKIMSKKEAVSLLVERLNADFSMGIELDEWIDLAQPETRQQVLEDIFRKKLPSRPDVYIRPYIILLGYASIDPDRLIRSIYDATVRQRPERSISITGKYSISEPVDAAVHYHKREMLFQGERPLYRPETSYSHWDEEAGVRQSTDLKAISKISNALAIIGLIATSGTSGEIKKVWDEIYPTLTVVGLDNARLLYADPDDMLIRPYHAGRRRHVIYIPKIFLMDMDGDDAGDMNELAEYLYHAMHWFFVYEHETRERVRSRLNEESAALTKNDGLLGLVEAGDIRARFHYMMEEETVNMCRSVPKHVANYGPYRAWLGDEKAEAGSQGISVSQIEEIMRISAKYAYSCELLGAVEAAKEFYANWHEAVRLMQSYELDNPAVAVKFQERLVIFYLKRGMFREFLRELKVMLTGDGYPDIILKDDSKYENPAKAREDQLLSMFLYADERIACPRFKREIEYTLDYYSSINKDQGYRDMLAVVHDKAMNMLEGFKSSSGILKPADTEEIERAEKAEDPAIQEALLDLFIENTFQILNRVKNGAPLEEERIRELYMSGIRVYKMPLIRHLSAKRKKLLTYFILINIHPRGINMGSVARNNEARRFLLFEVFASPEKDIYEPAIEAIIEIMARHHGKSDHYHRSFYPIMAESANLGIDAFAKAMRDILLKSYRGEIEMFDTDEGGNLPGQGAFLDQAVEMIKELASDKGLPSFRGKISEQLIDAASSDGEARSFLEGILQDLGVDPAAIKNGKGSLAPGTIPEGGAVSLNRALEMLKGYGQEHLLNDWDMLSAAEKTGLLTDIERVNWAEANRLYDEMVVKRKIPTHIKEGFDYSQPVLERRLEAGEAGEEVLRWGAPDDKAKFAVIVVAGGTGSGLKFEHPKGMFPAAPLSGRTLYQSIVHKMEAAARAYGHNKMYPLILMVSEQTEKETIGYFRGLPEWREISERVLFVRQNELPGLLRYPEDERDGKAFFGANGRLNLGGSGHGDAFDYVLKPGSGAEGTLWNEEEEPVMRIKVEEWLSRFGVEYAQYANVDNLLNPLADRYLIGEHVLSRDAAVEAEGRAHISIGMIRKTQWDEARSTFRDRLGNVIVVDGRKESVDYGEATDAVNASGYGDPSIKVVTIASLAGSIPIEFSKAEKTDRALGGAEVDIYKFERSSASKKRYGAELGYEGGDVFASIKKRDGDAEAETPATAKRLQSDHWKKLLNLAMPGLAIPDKCVIELPWGADYMSPESLMGKLSALHIGRYINEGSGLLISDDFDMLTVFGEDHKAIMVHRPVHRYRLVVDGDRLRISGMDILKPVGFEPMHVWYARIEKGRSRRSFAVIGRFGIKAPLYLAVDEGRDKLFVIRALMPDDGTEDDEDTGKHGDMEHCGGIDAMRGLLPRDYDGVYDAALMECTGVIGDTGHPLLSKGAFSTVVYSFVDGVNFEDYFKRYAGLPLKDYSQRLFDLVVRIGRICSFLEERNVDQVWDIRPDNIMVKPDGEPVLIDYTRMAFKPFNPIERLIYLPIIGYRSSEDELPNMRFVDDEGANTAIIEKLQEIRRKNVHHVRQYGTIGELVEDIKKVRDMIAAANRDSQTTVLAEREEYLGRIQPYFAQVISALERYRLEDRAITAYYLMGSFARGDFRIPSKDVDIAVSFRHQSQSLTESKYASIVDEIDKISREARLNFHITPEPLGFVFDIGGDTIVQTDRVAGDYAYISRMGSIINPRDNRLIDLTGLADSASPNGEFLVKLSRNITRYNETHPAAGVLPEVADGATPDEDTDMGVNYDPFDSREEESEDISRAGDENRPSLGIDPASSGRGRGADEMEAFLSLMHIFVQNQLTERSSSVGARKILIAEELFDPEDAKGPLRAVLDKARIEILPAKDIRAWVTRNDSSNSKQNLACIVGREEFKVLWNKSHAIANKATVIVLDDNFKDDHYLFLEAAIGFAYAAMNKDEARIRIYTEVLFEEIDSYDEIADKLAAALMAQDSMGVTNIPLVFKTVPFDTQKLRDYKFMVDEYLRSA